LLITTASALALDEELLALPEYIAHFLKAEQVARLAGCKLIAIVYGNTVAGGFIGFGMGPDRVTLRSRKRDFRDEAGGHFAGD
jgi:hypothetical protein